MRSLTASEYALMLDNLYGRYRDATPLEHEMAATLVADGRWKLVELHGGLAAVTTPAGTAAMRLYVTLSA